MMNSSSTTLTNHHNNNNNNNYNNIESILNGYNNINLISSSLQQHINDFNNIQQTAISSYYQQAPASSSSSSSSSSPPSDEHITPRTPTSSSSSIIRDDSTATTTTIGVDSIIKILSNKYDWLRITEESTDNNNQIQLQQYRCTFICHFCNYYYNCDKILLSNIQQFVREQQQQQQQSSHSDGTNSHSIDINNLYQILNMHQQSNEHKTALHYTLTTRLPAVSTSISCSTAPNSHPITTTTTCSLASPTITTTTTTTTSTILSSTQQDQQQQLHTMLTSAVTDKVGLNGTSSSSIASIDPNTPQTSSVELMQICPFKDEEIDDCINEHVLDVDAEHFLQNLTGHTSLNDHTDTFYCHPSNENDHQSSSVDQQQPVTPLSAQTNAFTFDTNTGPPTTPTTATTTNSGTSSSSSNHYGSILKAINKRKLHISCPLCISKVVNMSDHLVKKHNIKDRNQRKHLMDSVRRNFLVNPSIQDATNCINLLTTPNDCGSISNIKRSLNASDYNTQQQAQIFEYSTTNPTGNNVNTLTTNTNHHHYRHHHHLQSKKNRKLIKCPICTDENKYFVNISDHLIKIHHLNTSEQRKPILKSIKVSIKNSSSSSPSSSSSSSSNTSTKSKIKSSITAINHQQQQQLIDTNDMLMNELNGTVANNTKLSDQHHYIQSYLNTNQQIDNSHQDADTQNSSIINDDDLIQYSLYEHSNTSCNNKNNVLRKSILKRYTKQMRKSKTNRTKRLTTTPYNTNTNNHDVPPATLSNDNLLKLDGLVKHLQDRDEHAESDEQELINNSNNSSTNNTNNNNNNLNNNELNNQQDCNENVVDCGDDNNNNNNENNPNEDDNLSCGDISETINYLNEQSIIAFNNDSNNESNSNNNNNNNQNNQNNNDHHHNLNTETSICSNGEDSQQHQNIFLANNDDLSIENIFNKINTIEKNFTSTVDKFNGYREKLNNCFGELKSILNEFHVLKQDINKILKDQQNSTTTTTTTTASSSITVQQLNAANNRVTNSLSSIVPLISNQPQKQIYQQQQQTPNLVYQLIPLNQQQQQQQSHPTSIIRSSSSQLINEVPNNLLIHKNQPNDPVNYNVYRTVKEERN